MASNGRLVSSENRRSDDAATCVWEVLGSNSGDETGYPDSHYSIQPNSENVPQVGYGHFLRNAYVSIIQRTISSFPVWRLIELWEKWQYQVNFMDQWYSTWGTRTPPGYTKTSYINHYETQEPLEPWTSSDPRTHEDSSTNWGAGMPETSSIISLTDHNHINNW
jgi:hypothetical protein